MIFETKLYYNVMHSVILLVPKIAHFMKSVTSFIFISLFASMKLYHLPIQTSLQYDNYIYTSFIKHELLHILSALDVYIIIIK